MSIFTRLNQSKSSFQFQIHFHQVTQLYLDRTIEEQKDGALALASAAPLSEREEETYYCSCERNGKKYRTRERKAVNSHPNSLHHSSTAVPVAAPPPPPHQHDSIVSHVAAADPPQPVAHANGIVTHSNHVDPSPNVIDRSSPPSSSSSDGSSMIVFDETLTFGCTLYKSQDSYVFSKKVFRLRLKSCSDKKAYSSRHFKKKKKQCVDLFTDVNLAAFASKGVRHAILTFPLEGKLNDHTSFHHHEDGRPKPQLQCTITCVWVHDTIKDRDGYSSCSSQHHSNRHSSSFSISRSNLSSNNGYELSTFSTYQRNGLDTLRYADSREPSRTTTSMMSPYGQQPVAFYGQDGSNVWDNNQIGTATIYDGFPILPPHPSQSQPQQLSPTSLTPLPHGPMPPPLSTPPFQAQSSSLLLSSMSVTPRPLISPTPTHTGTVLGSMRHRANSNGTTTNNNTNMTILESKEYEEHMTILDRSYSTSSTTTTNPIIRSQPHHSPRAHTSLPPSSSPSSSSSSSDGVYDELSSIDIVGRILSHHTTHTHIHTHPRSSPSHHHPSSLPPIIQEETTTATIIPASSNGLSVVGGGGADDWMSGILSDLSLAPPIVIPDGSKLITHVPTTSSSSVGVDVHATTSSLLPSASSSLALPASSSLIETTTTTNIDMTLTPSMHTLTTTSLSSSPFHQCLTILQLPVMIGGKIDIQRMGEISHQRQTFDSVTSLLSASSSSSSSSCLNPSPPPSVQHISSISFSALIDPHLWRSGRFGTCWRAKMERRLLPTYDSFTTTLTMTTPSSSDASSTIDETHIDVLIKVPRSKVGPSEIAELLSFLNLPRSNHVLPLIGLVTDWPPSTTLSNDSESHIDTCPPSSSTPVAAHSSASSSSSSPLFCIVTELQCCNLKELCLELPTWTTFIRRHHAEDDETCNNVHDNQRHDVDLSQRPSSDPLLLLQLLHEMSLAVRHFHRHGRVHRDLALRNFLFGRKNQVILCDFGLAQVLERHTSIIGVDVVDGGVGADPPPRSHDTDLLPLRWCAPESLLSHRFTMSSDIYTFGVACWELITQTSTLPYSEVSNLRDFISLLCTNEIRLSFDKRCCSASLEQLFSQCLSVQASKRPTIEVITTTIEEIMRQQYG